MSKSFKIMVLGFIIGFFACEMIPSIPYDRYNSEIKATAIITKLYVGVCPNSNGVSAIRDAYISTVDNVFKKSYLLSNFDNVFIDECNKTTVVKLSTPE